MKTASFFSNITGVKQTLQKQHVLAVPAPGMSGLYFALALGIVNKDMRKQAAPLLENYLPDSEQSINWQKLSTQSQGPLLITKALAKALPLLVKKKLEAEPARYCHTLNALHRFDEQMMVQPAEVLKYTVCSIVSDFLNTNIILKVQNESQTLPAKYAFNKKTSHCLELVYNNSRNLFCSVLTHPPQCFFNLKDRDIPDNERLSINIKEFCKNTESHAQQKATAYATALNAQEISLQDLKKEYATKFRPLFTSGERNLDLQQPPLIKDFPDAEGIMQLISGLVWFEVCDEFMSHHPLIENQTRKMAI